jgi:bifunctional non-homologous end joining protein LigD
VKVGRREVNVSSPDKVLFPEVGLTKEGLAEYYAAVAKWSIPHIRDRPLNLNVYPQGITGKGFFQQHASDHYPDWVDRVEVPKRDGKVVHVMANKAETLVYLAGQNAVTLHYWPSRADRLDRPDRMVFDLDPPEGDFDAARSAALALGELLRELGLEPFVMTTGSKGLHVVVPLQRRQEHPAVREFARGVAEAFIERDPELVTLEWYKDKRGGRILIDVRATRGMSVVAPYSVRAKPEASVAAPIPWKELSDEELTARRYTVANVLERKADPWAKIDDSARALGEPAKRLKRL